MTLYPYTENIPFSSDNPSDDQPIMLQNTNSIFGLIQEDHVGFGVNNGGFHQQLRMPVQSAAPVNTIANSANLYSKLADAISPAQRGNFWCSADNDPTQFQLTRMIPVASASFGPHAPGWTWLPGGLLLQYGFVTSVTSGDVSFAVPFTSTVLSLNTSGFYTGADPNGNASIAVKITGAGPVTGFHWVFLTNSGSYNGFYWTAIGI